MTSELTPFDADDLVRKYIAKTPLKDILREFNISQHGFWKIINGRGIPHNRPRASLDNESVISRYAAGESQREISTSLGVTDKVIARILRNHGIHLRSRAEQTVYENCVRTGLSEDDVIRLFESGVGIRGIFENHGFVVAATKTILKSRGIPARDRSAQQLARMQRASPEERLQLASKAHEAVRGRKRSDSEGIKAARTIEARGAHDSPIESALAQMLLERGICTTPQQAFGQYNCDLGACPVAVEVFGGNWHWSGRHLARTEKRTKFLLNAGYHVLMVAIQKRFPLTPAVADYVASYIKQARANPTARREYRVVWGAGEFTTAGCLDDDHFSIEPPFTSARNPSTGQYETVPR